MRLLAVTWALLLASSCVAVAYGGPPTASGRHAYVVEGSATVSGSPGDGAARATTTRLRLHEDQQPQLGAGFPQLQVAITPHTPARLHVKITPDGGVKRWEVPESIVPRPAADDGLRDDSLMYEVPQPLQAAPGSPFALTVLRRASGQPIFDSRGHSFLFKDQYIELTSSVPEDADLYGLGEAALPGGLLLPRGGEHIAMWARDSAPATPGINTYGTHPFLLQVHRDGSASGLVFLNSNGMDVQLNKTSVTWRAIGGVVDLYFFLGPTPEAVIRQYHEVVGAPAMPPFWALGAHQGKWGYATVADLEEVLDNYTAAGLPLEGLWVDIEYFDGRFQVFTFSKDRYPPAEMRRFADKLAASGRHWAPIHNPGVAVVRGYQAYEEGSAQGIWIKDARGQPYNGQVWPGVVHYPDFLHPPTDAWLQQQLKRMHDQVPFSGMWLDVSEAANFCSGMVCSAPLGNSTAMHALEAPTPLDFNVTQITKYRTTCELQCSDAPPSDEANWKLQQPPYAIHNFAWRKGLSNNGPRDPARDGLPRASLDTKAISVTARHVDGTSEYDAHNLYGTSMALAFNKAFSAISSKRLFMLTRSTSPGAGRVTGHWTGDTLVSWAAFREATATVLASNMWGLAMTGADVCGYGITGKHNLTDAEFQELCVRWTSAGAFYPFSRNHMNYFVQPHEPYRWASVTAAAKKAYGLRYRLLSYLYSSMWLAHTQGGTLARPLLFADPADTAARNATQQWMLGEAVLVSPVTTPGTTRFAPYFTPGRWYSAWDLSLIERKAGGPVALDVPLGDVPVHIRGGAIVPLQQPALVTRDVRLSPVTLVVALPGAAAPGGSEAYALDEPCASARARHGGQQLVSCGLLYADDDAQRVSEAASVLSWFVAATGPSGRAGTVYNAVHAAHVELKSKLRITAITIVGLPAKAAAAAAPHAPSGVAAAAAAASQHRARARGLAPKAHAPSWSLAQESHRLPGPSATVRAAAARGASEASVRFREAAGGHGVLEISGLDLEVGEPFKLEWSL